MIIVGLMSGTSLDGVDAALVKVDGSGINTKVELIDFITLPISLELKKEIEKSLSVHSSNVQLICSLNFKLGYLFAEAVKMICNKNNLPLTEIDLIGSHGQTIYHQPIAEGGFYAFDTSNWRAGSHSLRNRRKSHIEF